MANNPKMFFWLKLREDFFLTNPYVKKLMRMEHGDSLVLLYLRLQTFSLKNNCVIHYEGIEPTLAEEIAFILDADPDLTKTLVDYLIRYKLLIDMGDDDYLLTEAIDATGKETENAQMNRERRKREKEEASEDATGEESEIRVTEGNTEVTKNNNVNTEVTEGNIVTFGVTEGNFVTQRREEKIREDKSIINTHTSKNDENENPNPDPAEQAQRVHPLEQKLIDLYHEKCPSLPKVLKITDQRRRRIRKMFKKYTLTDFAKAFEIAEKSAFLRGECPSPGHESFKADFDFFLDERKLISTLEGKYSGSGSGGGSGGGRHHMMESDTDYGALEAMLEEEQLQKAQGIACPDDS